VSPTAQASDRRPSFEQDPASPAGELELYTEVVPILKDMGFPVLQLHASP